MGLGLGSGLGLRELGVPSVEIYAPIKSLVLNRTLDPVEGKKITSQIMRILRAYIMRAEIASSHLLDNIGAC